MNLKTRKMSFQLQIYSLEWAIARANELKASGQSHCPIAEEIIMLAMAPPASGKDRKPFKP